PAGRGARQRQAGDRGHDDLRARSPARRTVGLASPRSLRSRGYFFLITSSTEPTFAALDAHFAQRASGRKYRIASSSAGARTSAQTTRSSTPIESAMPRVSRSNGPARANATQA